MFGNSMVSVFALHVLNAVVCLLIATSNVHAVETGIARIVISSDPPMQSLMNLAPDTQVILSATVYSKGGVATPCENPGWSLGKNSLSKAIAKGAVEINKFRIFIGQDAGTAQVQVTCDNAGNQIGRHIVSSSGGAATGVNPTAATPTHVTPTTANPSSAALKAMRKPPGMPAGTRALIIGGAAVAGVGIAAAIASSIDFQTPTSGEGNHCPSYSDICGESTLAGSGISASCGCPNGTSQSGPQGCFPGDRSGSCVTCAC